MRRRSTLFALLSLALVLVCWMTPSAAQAAPAARVHAKPPAASRVVADLPDGDKLVSLTFSARICTAPILPFAAPAILCPNCPPGYTSCGYPLCRCCGGK